MTLFTSYRSHFGSSSSKTFPGPGDSLSLQPVSFAWRYAALSGSEQCDRDAMETGGRELREPAKTGQRASSDFFGSIERRPRKRSVLPRSIVPERHYEFENLSKEESA